MYYYGQIGDFGGGNSSPNTPKYTVIQSLWTKPLFAVNQTEQQKERIKDTMFICALSLAYAHNSGYKVHMHTDSKGAELFKNFGYDGLFTTLDKIPNTVPTDLFAAGKFYAMKAEGITGKVHIDIDVFLKKPGIVDSFYENKKIDVICQQEEDISGYNYSRKVAPFMHVLGYPPTTRPDWDGSMNTGVIGFNNSKLAKKYFDNYFDALKMYTKDKFEAYKKTHPEASLKFDFILEQVNLSYLSIGYNAYTLVSKENPCYVADEIGYQHLQGTTKWSDTSKVKVRTLLLNMNKDLYSVANRAASQAIKS